MTLPSYTSTFPLNFYSEMSRHASDVHTYGCNLCSKSKVIPLEWEDIVLESIPEIRKFYLHFIVDNLR